MNVTLIPTHISVGNVTAHPGDNVTVPINVTADDGVAFNGVVYVTLPDNSTVPVDVVNGSGVVPWTVPDDFEEGVYPVNATFDGNDRYLPSNGTGSVTVERVPTHITVGNVTASPGDNVTIPVTVTADDNLPFNGNITVVLPDGSRQTVEIINGSGNIYWTIPDDYDGNYSDVFTFEGNDYYLPSNATGIITVFLIDVQLNITVDKSLVYYGDMVEFTITVRNNGPGNATEVTVVNIIPKEFIYISDSFGDVNYQDTENMLMASSTIQSYDPATGVWYIGDLASGEESKLTILARANFIGTKQVNSSVSIAEIETNYTNNNGTADVTVIQVPTHISADNVTAHPGDEVNIPINVTADDDVPFNGNVTVTLPDGSNQTVEIVNGSGSVDWNVPYDFKEGDYPVNATFDGNDRYLPSNGTGIVAVEKVPTAITVGNVTVKPGEKVNIPIIVTTGDGSQFNGNVTVKLPDGSTKVVEIINGVGSVTWTVPNDYDGIFAVYVSFDGDNYYLPSNGTGFITVIPDAPVTPVTPVTPEHAPVKENISMDSKATGNPLMVLLVVLALLGVNTRRKK